MAVKQVTIGAKVGDFTLKDQKNKDFILSDFKGRMVVLSFHPLAWTEICATQMKALEKKTKAFEKANAVAVGISIDSVPCKQAWAKSLRVKNTRLLADFWPHGKIAKSLGIFDDTNGFSKRATMVLDEKGRVIFSKVYPLQQVPDIEEIMAAVHTS